MNANWVDLSLTTGTKFGKIYGDGSHNYEQLSDGLKVFEQNTESSRQINLSGTPPNNGDVKAWIKNIVDRPVPLRYKLYEIADLFISLKNTEFNASQAKNSFYATLNRYCGKEVSCQFSSGDSWEPDAVEYAQMQSKQLYPVNKIPPSYLEANIKFISYEAVKFSTRGTKDLPNWQLGIMFSDDFETYFSPWSGIRGVAFGSDVEWFVPSGQYVSQI